MIIIKLIQLGSVDIALHQVSGITNKANAWYVPKVLSTIKLYQYVLVQLISHIFPMNLNVLNAKLSGMKPQKHALNVKIVRVGMLQLKSVLVLEISRLMLKDTVFLVLLLITGASIRKYVSDVPMDLLTIKHHKNVHVPQINLIWIKIISVFLVTPNGILLPLLVRYVNLEPSGMLLQNHV